MEDKLRQAEAYEIQNKFDRHLFELELQAITDEMQRGINLRAWLVNIKWGIPPGQTEARMSQGKTAAFFEARVDSAANVLPEYLEEVADLCRKIWRMQGYEITEPFVRAVLAPTVLKILFAWSRILRSQISRMGASQLANSGRVFRNLSKAINDLRARLKNGYEIEARELAYNTPIVSRRTGAPVAPEAPAILRASVNRINQRKEERKSIVTPILEKKGWSIGDWATESKVDFHTAGRYLKGVTNPYPNTRKKLALSLGLSIESFPR